MDGTVFKLLNLDQLLKLIYTFFFCFVGFGVAHFFLLLLYINYFQLLFINNSVSVLLFLLRWMCRARLLRAIWHTRSCDAIKPNGTLKPQLNNSSTKHWRKKKQKSTLLNVRRKKWVIKGVCMYDYLWHRWCCLPTSWTYSPALINHSNCTALTVTQVNCSCFSLPTKNIKN